jgi:hypothetical protein
MTDFHARIIGTLGGSRPWSMGFHLTGSVSEGTLSTTFTNAAIALFDTTTDGIKNYVTSDVVAVSTEVDTLSPTMTVVSGTTGTVNVTGIATGDSLPWHEAFLVQEYSTSKLKGARAYQYGPPLAETFSASHVWTAGFMASAKIVFDVFFPAIHASGVQSFSFNRLADVDGTPAFTKQLLSAYRLSNKPSTQRRRTKKVPTTYTNGGAF